jgi:hypothetical protein
LAGRMPFTRANSERHSCNQDQILLHQVSQFEHTKRAKERLTQRSRILFFFPRAWQLALVTAESEPSSVSSVFKKQAGDASPTLVLFTPAGNRID